MDNCTQWCIDAGDYMQYGLVLGQRHCYGPNIIDVHHDHSPQMAEP